MKKAWIVVMLVGFWLSGCEKTKLDEEVRRLCAQDGGLKIYETVTLPASQYDKYVDKYGRFRLPTAREATAQDEYIYESKTEFLREGSPSLRRYYDAVIRRSDGRILGQLVIYGRVGGDLPGPWHDSSFACPQFESNVEIQQAVIKRAPK